MGLNDRGHCLRLMESRFANEGWRLRNLGDLANPRIRSFGPAETNWLDDRDWRIWSRNRFHGRSGADFPWPISM
jgi:hypothetical protein